MKNHAANIQDFDSNVLYRQKSPTKLKGSRETLPVEGEESNHFVKGGWALLPEYPRRSSEMPRKHISDDYGDMYPADALKGNTNWGHDIVLNYPTKQFPNFKSEGTEQRKYPKTAKIPTGYSCKEHFCELGNVDHLEIDRSRNKTKEHLNRDKMNTSKNMKYSKKVKWKDGFGDIGCYTIEPEYRNCHREYSFPISEQAYFKNKGLKYDSKNHKNLHKYRKFLYPRYGYFTHGDQRVHPYAKPFDYRIYNHPEYFTPWYKNPENWNFRQHSKNYLPYYNDYDGYRYVDIQKSYRNKKLQVSKSETSNSKKNRDIKCNKLNEEGANNKLTPSNQDLRHVSTQLNDAKSQNNTISNGKSEPQSTEYHKLDETTIVNRLLSELTDKLRTSDLSEPAPCKKCVLVDRDTQFDKCDIKKTWTCEEPRNFIRILKHEETQYEDHMITANYNNKISYSLNNDTINENKTRHFRRNSVFDNLGESQKGRSMKCELQEDRNEVKYSVKRKAIAKNAKEAVYEETTIENADSNTNIPGQLSRLNGEHCRPFVIDGKHNDCRRRTLSLNQKIANKEKERKHFNEREDRGYFNNDNLKERQEEEQKMAAIRNELQIHSQTISFSKYDDLCGPDDSFLEKFIVKLSNPNERITLYNVKPKFFSYLTKRGVNKNVIDKLKLCLNNR